MRGLTRFTCSESLPFRLKRKPFLSPKKEKKKKKKKRELKRKPIETNLSCDLHVDVRKHKNHGQPSKEEKTKLENQA